MARTQAKLSITECHFESSTAGAGGAVYLATELADCDVRDTTFLECSAGQGGAIATTGQLQCSNCTFTYDSLTPSRTA